MIEFDTNHIIVGYIKQLLSSFNLPKYRIYTHENKDYFNKYNTELNIIPTVTREDSIFPEAMKYAYYIKDGTIQYYKATPIKQNDGTITYSYNWVSTNKRFFWNYNETNHVTHLKINNNIYDAYTHEYLGNYLRFKRDYEGINLMSLYNCFSNTVCNDLDYSEELKYITTDFTASNQNFKIFMLPVKLFKNYTIAIDCDSNIEICCGIYGKYVDKRAKLSAIPAYTYQKYNNVNFSTPFLYTKLTTLNDFISGANLSDLAACEDNLKLFIRIPASNSSSIVILEGDYRNYNDSINTLWSKSLTKNNDEVLKYGFSRQQNTSKINFEYGSDTCFDQIKLTSPLQLLRLNTNTSYPFADRLIEYLLGNAIDSKDEILDNIKRVQKVLDPSISYFTPGIWNSSMKAILYDLFNNNCEASINNNDTNHDILGYVDKDIEKVLPEVDLYTKNGLYNEEDK